MEYETDSDFDIPSELIELRTIVDGLTAKSEKGFQHRMSYLTWCLANPVSLIIIPTLGSIFIQIVINNIDKPFIEWSVSSLTTGTNWTIPLLIGIVGLIVSLGISYTY